MILIIASIAISAPATAQREDDPHYKPVKPIGAGTFAVTVGAQSGTARYFGTGSLDGSPNATRAVIDIHGLLRNADAYETTGEAALAAAGETQDTLLITPQFLAQIDVTGHGLPADTLRWDVQSWLDGYPALGPAPISSFAVLDAMLERLSDRSRFPALHEIVVAGHSAGGQLVQRYAIVGRAPDAIASKTLTVRFVVANPSSYLYFTPERPASGGFATFDGATCPSFNRWKYGVDDPPPYAGGPVGALEARYVARNVTYLLGQLDVDPNHPVLDKSCAAEAEGPYRLARGRSYIEYLRRRHPHGTLQSFAEVSGVDHDAAGMFTSPCGIAVLFDRPRNVCAAAGAL